MRKFSVNINDVIDHRPILPVGIYAGVLSGCTIEGKSNKQYIAIKDEYTWKNGERKATGKKILEGMLMLGVVLTSEKAKKILAQDEAKVYAMLNLRFDRETGVLDLRRNIAIRQLVDTLGVDFNAIQDGVDESMDSIESMEIPEEFQEIDNIEVLFPAMLYWREVFFALCTQLNGQPVRTQITHRPSNLDKSVQEHTINTGTVGAPFCGILQYVPGCEDDITE